MDATTARIMVWEKLRKVARADSRFAWDFAEFIADYEGSDKMCIRDRPRMAALSSETGCSR